MTWPTRRRLTRPRPRQLALLRLLAYLSTLERLTDRQAQRADVQMDLIARLIQDRDQLQQQVCDLDARLAALEALADVAFTAEADVPCGAASAALGRCCGCGGGTGCGGARAQGVGAAGQGSAGVSRKLRSAAKSRK